MTQLAFIYSKTRFSAKLTKFWTGSYCYHVGFLSNGIFYDMHLLRRKRIWAEYSKDKEFTLINSPVPVSQEYLEHKLVTDTSAYGVFDYLLFSLRFIFHLFGESTPNAKGIICSEMVADDLIANGWGYVFKEVPSPADLKRILL